MNLVLERLREQRAEQISTMDAILAQVENRDLVDAERSILNACRDRLGEIDAQIEPLAAFESIRDAHGTALDALARPAIPAQPRAVGGLEARNPYASPGAFVVDYLRAFGILDRSAARDEAAAGRIAQSRAVGDQTTADTPGLLPQPVVGSGRKPD